MPIMANANVMNPALMSMVINKVLTSFYLTVAKVNRIAFNEVRSDYCFTNISFCCEKSWAVCKNFTISFHSSFGNALVV